MNPEPACTCVDCPIHHGTIGNIRSLDSFRDNLWSHSIWDDCYRGKIREADLDGIVERHGHLLLSEGKNDGANGRGEGNLTEGQRIMFENASRRGGTVTVVMFEGTPPSGPITNAIVWWNGKVDRQLNTLEEVHKFKSDWFRWADRN